VEGACVLSHSKTGHRGHRRTGHGKKTLSDRWILSKLDRCVRGTDRSISSASVNDANGAPLHLIGDELSRLYLEAIKRGSTGGRAGGDCGAGRRGGTASNVLRAAAIRCAP